MRKRIFYYSLAILFLTGYSQYYGNPYFSGNVYAQETTDNTDNTTKSQKNLKKEKKKRMKEQIKQDKNALKRHWDIQSKATRKRMKKHLKETKKNIKKSHR